MPKWTVCTSCPNLHTGKGKCPTCRAADDKTRRPHGNPYTSRGHLAFRAAVLKRDQLCVICGATATIADHWPTERRDLVAQGLNPDDPTRGRGLCKRCHDHHTATTSPSGWGRT